MEYKDREGRILGADDGQDRLLSGLYGSRAGRALVRFLIRPGISRAGGWLLDRRVSRIAVGPFVRSKGIRLDDYEKQDFCSYNDFFTRRIKAGLRPADMTPEALIAPCDSKLTVYAIDEDARFTVKGTGYTMESLTRSRKLARKYAGGQLLLFRLTVDDYHHYCYVDGGRKSENHYIDGVFHTVNPAACEKFPVYKENSRCVSFLKSDHFGTVMMIEVGALMVGKIVNLDDGPALVRRGEEKGYFAFGGSTVILCLKKGRAVMDSDILANSREGCETRVLQGMRIGTAAK